MNWIHTMHLNFQIHVPNWILDVYFEFQTHWMNWICISHGDQVVDTGLDQVSCPNLFMKLFAFGSNQAQAKLIITTVTITNFEHHNHRQNYIANAFMTWMSKCTWTFQMHVQWRSAANTDPITHEETEEGHNQNHSTLEHLSQTCGGDQVVDQCRPSADHVVNQAKTKQKLPGLCLVYNVIYTWSRRGQSTFPTPLSAFGGRQIERILSEHALNVYLCFCALHRTHAHMCDVRRTVRACTCVHVCSDCVRMCVFVHLCRDGAMCLLQNAMIGVQTRNAFFSDVFFATILDWDFKCILWIGHACTNF